jgi:DNA-binding NarL/FixJ family response regulator
MRGERAGTPSPSPGRSFAAVREGPRIALAPDEMAGAGTQVAEPPRILILEDDYLIATQIEAALMQAGFDIAGIASSAEEATELAASERPALVVADIRLAGKRDGIDTAIQLFRDHGIRSIFATAHHNQETRRRAKPANPLGWLPKPYTMAALVQLVRQALSDMHEGKQ